MRPLAYVSTATLRRWASFLDRHAPRAMRRTIVAIRLELWSRAYEEAYTLTSDYDADA